ncbi:MAG: glycoside hydrolase family 28 protein, partial [Acidobacteriota bacterium]
RFSRLQKEDRARLGRYGDEGVPVEQRGFGRGSKLRPLMIQFYRCRNVLIEGLTIKDSPFWHIHPVLSQNVTIKDVTVTGMGPNNDGCDPESSRDVLISGCTFNTGDDCIAIKSGRNNDGRRVGIPSEDIVVRDCVMKNGHGGVVMCSEMTGGIRSVFIEDCTMDSPHLDRAIRIKTNAVRGGFVENVFVRRITIGQVAEAVLKVNFRYEEGDHGPYTPVVRNIQMEGITGRQCGRVLYLDGYDRSPIRGVALRNCTFQSVAQPDFIRGVKNLVLENVRANGKALEAAPADASPAPMR